MQSQADFLPVKTDSHRYLRACFSSRNTSYHALNLSDMKAFSITSSSRLELTVCFHLKDVVVDMVCPSVMVKSPTYWIRLFLFADDPEFLFVSNVPAS